MHKDPSVLILSQVKQSLRQTACLIWIHNSGSGIGMEHRNRAEGGRDRILLSDNLTLIVSTTTRQWEKLGLDVGVCRRKILLIWTDFTGSLNICPNRISDITMYGGWDWGQILLILWYHQLLQTFLKYFLSPQTISVSPATTHHTSLRTDHLNLF